MIARHELIVDSFAGGGGASLGVYLATGRHPDIAINHDADAIALHAVNHPTTRHYREDVWKVDPIEATAGRPVGLMWLSPDCKHFSKAKGGKPVSKRVRGLAWVAVRWAAAVKPRVIVLENVEEFQTWGPVSRDTMRPCSKRKGSTFRRFVATLRRHGYAVEWRELRACDYGAPTIRKRLFLVARCDGVAIQWPTPTHGKGRAPYRAAAECIDWSIPCPSIFTRTRPLADATLRRVAAGVEKFVVKAARPFIVQVQNASSGNAPIDIDKPLNTITAHPKGGGFALVSAFLAKHYTGVVGSALAAPMGTVTTVDHHSLVQAFLVAYYGNEKDGGALSDPLRTLSTRDRFGLVMVDGAPHRIADIGLRMMAPRELYRAQGFPDSYIIDTDADGNAITKTAQVRMVGNSVCPPVAAAIVGAQFASRAAGDAWMQDADLFTLAGAS